MVRSSASSPQTPTEASSLDFAPPGIIPGYAAATWIIRGVKAKMHQIDFWAILR